jgi:hypothetical protein
MPSLPRSLPLLAAAIAILLGVTACGAFWRNGPSPPARGGRDTADIGMAPYADFGNSTGSPAGANASVASSGSVPRGPAASNYNGPNTPPDPSPRPTAGQT